MVQKRKTSTKEDIKEALIQLLSEERFDTIPKRDLPTAKVHIFKDRNHFFQPTFPELKEPLEQKQFQNQSLLVP